MFRLHAVVVSVVLLSSCGASPSTDGDFVAAQDPVAVLRTVVGAGVFHGTGGATKGALSACTLTVGFTISDNAFVTFNGDGLMVTLTVDKTCKAGTSYKGTPAERTIIDCPGDLVGQLASNLGISAWADGRLSADVGTRFCDVPRK